MGMPEVVVDGEVIEADPPRKLVQTWRSYGTTDRSRKVPRASPTRSTRAEGGVSRLTVTHDLEDAPSTAAMVAGEIEDARAAGLELGPQRSQDAARDRRAAARADATDGLHRGVAPCGGASVELRGWDSNPQPFD